MNERLKDKIYSKIDEIDAKHKGESWNEDDLLALAEHSYNLALEDVKNEIESRIKKWHCNDFVTEMESGPDGDNGFLDFLDNLTK